MEDEAKEPQPTVAQRRGDYAAAQLLGPTAWSEVMGTKITKCDDGTEVEELDDEEFIRGVCFGHDTFIYPDDVVQRIESIQDTWIAIRRLSRDTGLTLAEVETLEGAETVCSALISKVRRAAKGEM